MPEATAPVIQMIGPLGRRDGWANTNTECPMARTLDVVGARSAFLILREALYGSTRFEQFVDRADISEPVAAARLRELTAEGLLEKVPYREPGQRTRHEYRLTEKGADLLPTLAAMMAWGDRWLFPDRARVHLTHAGCGGEVGTVLTCDAGHEVSASELQLEARKRPQAGQATTNSPRA
jgi:DNA-binding HxlR family transcriptional regulator